VLGVVLAGISAGLAASRPSAWLRPPRPYPLPGRDAVKRRGFLERPTRPGRVVTIGVGGAVLGGEGRQLRGWLVETTSRGRPGLYLHRVPMRGPAGLSHSKNHDDAGPMRSERP
jgi:hypothetical protein